MPKGKSETALTKLIHDFHCTDSDNMNSKVLAKRMRNLKASEEEMTKMCKEVERYAKKAVNQAVNKAIDETKDNFILKMLKRGKMTLQEIAEDYSVTIEHVMSIAKENDIKLA